jgi:hypothetical protein
MARGKGQNTIRKTGPGPAGGSKGKGKGSGSKGSKGK